MTQTVSGPVPSDQELYFNDLDAIEGMSTRQTLMGVTSVTCHYTVTPSGADWQVTYPDDVSSSAVDAVVNPSGG